MIERQLIELLLEDPDSELMPRALEWRICGQCHGEGTSSLYLGAYTASEFYEMDEDWRDDYMDGRFDRTCESCEGSGKVQEIREDWLAQHPAVQAELDEWYQTEAMYEAERRAGA
jgi:hypothetical protein